MSSATQAPAHRRVVFPHGALTGASAESLLDSLRVGTRCGEVEIDLSNVTRVDRGGAMVLLDAYVATVLRHAAFAVSGVSSACFDSLKRFGVLDVVDVIRPRSDSRSERSPS